MSAVFIGNKLKWEVLDSIGYIHLVDPPENRMNAVFFKELDKIINDFVPKSDHSAIIVSGVGRHFSSGAELEDLFKVVKEKKMDLLIDNYTLLKKLNELHVPVIAAIKGVCIGAAFELALHCHFRLCAEDAILGLPESSFGIIPGLDGISKMLVHAGKAKTMELVLSGQHFNASDAFKWQLADRVFPKKMLFEKAIELAKVSAGNYRKYNKEDYLKKS